MYLQIGNAFWSDDRIMDHAGRQVKSVAYLYDSACNVNSRA
jgi:hypothetical protein